MKETHKPCPMCSEEILVSARKCKHCGTLLDADGIVVPVTLGTPSGALAPADLAAARASDMGILLLIIPLVATVLIWFWVSGMNLLQAPSDTMVFILLGVVLGTATVAAMEAKSAGMVSNRKQGSYSPMAWFLVIALIWIIGYPAYLFKRRHYRLPNLLVGGVLVGLIFLGSWAAMFSAIEAQKAEIRGNLEKVQQNLQSLGIAPASGQAQAPSPAVTAPVEAPSVLNTANTFFSLCAQRVMPKAKMLGGMTDAEALQHAKEVCPEAEPVYVACMKQQSAQEQCLDKALPSGE